MTQLIEVVDRWIQQVVIDLGLCPFAYEVHAKKQILFVTTEFREAEPFVELLQNCITHILSSDLTETTALIIINSGLEKFEDYMLVYYSLEKLLPQLEQGEEIQLASFHPDYSFADAESDSLSNYTNRSPLPIIHLLRRADVTAAIDSHPEIASVPTDNIRKMEELGEQGIGALMKRVMKVDI